jgi:hypothetical protein
MKITQIKKLHTFCLGLNISLENYCQTQIDHRLNNTPLSILALPLVNLKKQQLDFIFIPYIYLNAVSLNKDT